MATIDGSWGYEDPHDTLTLTEYKERERRLDEDGRTEVVEVHKKNYGARG